MTAINLNFPFTSRILIYFSIQLILLTVSVAFNCMKVVWTSASLYKTKYFHYISESRHWLSILFRPSHWLTMMSTGNLLLLDPDKVAFFKSSFSNSFLLPHERWRGFSSQCFASALVSVRIQIRYLDQNSDPDPGEPNQCGGYMRIEIRTLVSLCRHIWGWNFKSPRSLE